MQLAWSRSPAGLALLRLTQRQTDAAATMSRRVVTEPCDRSNRVQILCGHVEIMIRRRRPRRCSRRGRRAGQTRCRHAGAVAAGHDLAGVGTRAPRRGRAGEAFGALRRAQEESVAIEAPYQAARTRVLVAAACDALLDPDSATIERRAARAVFEELGAVPDARGLVEPTGHDQVLSGREIEVLRLVARGLTNRAIGARLGTQRANGRAAPQQHLPQGGCAQPGGGNGLCLRAPPGRARTGWFHSSSWCHRMCDSPDAAAD